MTVFVRFLIASTVVLLSIPVSAASWELIVEGQVPVFARPRAGAKVVTTLSSGDMVPISKKNHQGFRSVRIMNKGRKIRGYVRQSDLLESYVDKSTGSERSQNNKNKQWQAGVGFRSSYLTQGARSISNSSGETNKIGQFTSLTFFPTIYVEGPWGDENRVRFFYNRRTTEFSGEVENSDSPMGDDKASLAQSFHGLGLLVKFIDKNSKGSWFAVGVEASLGTSVELKLEGAEVPTTDSDLPFFAMALAGLGWEYQVGPWSFVPEFQLGMVLNTDPIILVVEPQLAAVYSF